MYIQPVLCHRIVHVFDSHLQVVRATDTVPYGVGEVGQPSVRAALGSTEHSQVNNLFGHVSVACYLCSYVRDWVHTETHKNKLRYIYPNLLVLPRIPYLDLPVIQGLYKDLSQKHYV